MIQKGFRRVQVSVVMPTTGHPKEAKEPKKKRGRKPKGGKLVSLVAAGSSLTSGECEQEATPTVIVHLRCRLSDLVRGKGSGEGPKPAPADEHGTAWNESAGGGSTKARACSIDVKLAALSHSLHTDSVSDTKAACFWCTCDFDHPPVHIPKQAQGNGYAAYGCFCSPQCAAAHLFKENIDSAARFERYHLLNYVYGPAYQYSKNIKPAPDPHYTLDKFYGNLTIEEYRNMLQNDKLLLVVDKPLTRVLPDLLVDDETFVQESGAAVAGGKYRLKRKVRPSKSQVLTDRFNLPAS